MIINRFIYAKTPEMVLLKNGEVPKIGGVSDTIGLEMKDGKLVKVNCVYFNLDSSVESTDFFLFRTKDGQLTGYSLGKKTHPFFKKLYTNILHKNRHIDSFLTEFIAEYTSHGIMGDFPGNGN